MTTVIDSNGSKWAGEQPDGIEVLFDRLSTYALDPRFEPYGNFITPLDNEPRVRDARGMPLGSIQFWGNFYELSHVFSIDTDDADLIARLTAAIRANQATPAYVAARIERAEQIRMDQERQERKERERQAKREAEARRTLGIA